MRDHPLWTTASEEDIDCALEVRLSNNHNLIAHYISLMY